MTFALRVVLIVMLVIAVLNPKIPFGKGPVDVFVLWDDSPNGSDQADEAVWGEMRESLKDLQDGSRIALIRYGKNLVLQKPLTALQDTDLQRLLAKTRLPDSQALDSKVPNLSNALLLAVKLIEPNRSAALFMAHNGNMADDQTIGIIEDLQQRGHRLQQWNRANFDGAYPSEISNIDAPLFADSEQSIPVVVTIKGNHSGTIRLEWSVNGKPATGQIVEVSADRSTPVLFNADNCDPGICMINAELFSESDRKGQSSKYSIAVNIARSQSILMIRNKPGESPVSATLRKLNIPVKTVAPDLCVHWKDELSGYTTIFLDDIAVGDMASNCWLALEKAVNRLGTGLVVLGGPRSFSAGAYRHSLLESLLPVTAEASKQHQSVTLLFLIDKSGSMDKEAEGTQPIAVARQAVIDSLSAQSENDRFGLIAFDVQPHLLVPVGHYDNPEASIESAFNLKARGGTRVKPALDFALSELSKTDAGKRILVLVTDGFLDDRDLSDAAAQIAREKIEVIVLAIGNDLDTRNLQRFAESDNIKLLHIDKIPELPRLMRKEIDSNRNPLVKGPVKVLQPINLPFIEKNTTWPDLSGYMVTKAKPDSLVFLTSPTGDPLMSMRHSGIGKVIALPAGMEQWALNWLSWREWNRFVDGISTWSSNAGWHPRLNINAVKRNGETFLEIDAVTTEQSWLTSPENWMTIVHPEGRITSEMLKVAAPGRLIGKLPFDEPGLYSISIETGELKTSFGMMHVPLERLDYANRFNRSGLAISELIPEATLNRSIGKSGSLPLRIPLLLCGLMLYLLTIILSNQLACQLKIFLLKLFKRMNARV